MGLTWEGQREEEDDEETKYDDDDEHAVQKEKHKWNFNKTHSIRF